MTRRRSAMKASKSAACGVPHPEHQPHGPRDADGRRPAHAQHLDGLPHLLGGAARHVRRTPPAAASGRSARRSRRGLRSSGWCQMGSRAPPNRPRRRLDRPRTRTRPWALKGRTRSAASAVRVAPANLCHHLGQHRTDSTQQLLAFGNALRRTRLLSHKRVEARCALCGRTARVVEEPGAHATLSLAIPLRRVQQNGEGRAVELLRHLAQQTTAQGLTSANSRWLQPTNSSATLYASSDSW